MFEKLEADILGGKYRRGEILTELKLSSELGVSRTPIREALRRLSQENMIRYSGKGSVVLGITQKDVADIYAIRVLIEGLSARGASNNITEDGIRELREAIEFQEFYLAKSDAAQMRALDTRFHEIIYRYSGSEILTETLTPLHKKAQMVRKSSLEKRSRAEESVREHKAIFDAIASHDGDKAEELMKLHIENAGKSIAEIYAKKEI